jgi:hypothetical protein
MFDKLIFSEGRRFNIKLYSHQHWSDAEEIRVNAEQNLEFYKNKCNLSQFGEITKIDNRFRYHHLGVWHGNLDRESHLTWAQGTLRGAWSHHPHLNQAVSSAVTTFDSLLRV